MKHQPDDILDAAVRLVDRDGVGVSMAKVAAEAGVSNGTLFHYFSTKQELLDRLYAWLKSDLTDGLGHIDADLPPVDQLRELWGRWIAWARRHPRRHRVADVLRGAGLISPDVVAQGEAGFARYVALLVGLQDDGEISTLPVAYLSEILLTHLDVTACSELGAAQLSDAFDLAWRAIGARQEPTILQETR